MIFVSDIKAAVCRHYKLAAIEMVSHRRAAEVSHPRQVAMLLSKQMTVHSFPAIGKAVRPRSHDRHARGQSCGATLHR
jgi:chromosomal replication initiator protein